MKIAKNWKIYEAARSGPFSQIQYSYYSNPQDPRVELRDLILVLKFSVCKG